jgi:hypothetical protein
VKQNKQTIKMSNNGSSSGSSSFHESSTTNSERGSTEGSSAISGSSNQSKEQQEELAAKESRAVRKSRVAFVGVLALAAVVGGTITYLYSSRAEIKDFETEVSISSRHQY